MFKKLDILVLKAFIGPFLATFFITLFVFMMQILWKYIDDLVGKGLDLITLAKFLVYASATLVTLAMPISILLSSIMTFGKLGENFELVALKSSGISLLRFMRPLFFVSIVLSFVAFLFANNIAPLANLKFARIYHDIYRKSPAFDLKPGIFYEGFEGYAIKVGNKERDSVLYDILIYEQSGSPQDNTIISEKGIMTSGKNKQFMEFQLIDGHRYEENRKYNTVETEFIDLGFGTYVKLFDLSQLNMQNTPDSLFMDNIKMKSIRQLGEDLDSLRNDPDSLIRQNTRSLGNYIQYPALEDTAKSNRKKDSLINTIINKKADSVDVLIPDSLKYRVFNIAIGAISNAKNLMQISASEFSQVKKTISQIKVEWHKKLSLSIACIVLFFIGAPLGSIIRKGGLGLPLVMALIFFMIFYLLTIFGEKFTKDNLLTPFLGIWLPVMILTPVGIFLTYKAMHDSQLFNKESYYRFAERVSKILARKGKNISAE